MLKSMRKHAKYFYVLFVVIIISFVFWGVGTGSFGAKTTAVASVGGTKITLNQYLRVYERAEENMQDVYGSKFDDKMKKALKVQVLGEMINDIILSRAARDAGITVTDSELREAIMSEPVFKAGNVFSKNVYLRTLALNRMTPRDYEAMERRQLLVQKMTRLIEDPVQLSPPELAAVSEMAASAKVKNVPGKAGTADILREAVLRDKRQRAFISFIEGVSRRMHVTENLKPIS
ncbi:MAG: SurA N-terminal domain-containing protein [Nitrospiraceae bacterium]|nr:SurA N-terminal domain-containing protein [Nitrospiraceae bacterium]